MSRTLRLSLVTVLAASTWLCAGAATSSTAAGLAPDTVVKAFVAYGDPAVSVPPGHRARLSFIGRRGDIVRLNGFGHANGTRIALRTAGREVRARWGEFYRLGADGRYSFAVRVPSNHIYSSQLLLEKLTLRTLTRDGRPLTFNSTRRGFRPAVSFDLAAGKRTMIITPAYGATVLSGHSQQLVYGDPIIEVGQRLASARGDGFSGSPLRPGEVIVLAGRSGTVRAIESEIVPVTLDGNLTPVRASEARREVAVRFQATSGQLVHLVGVPVSTQVSPTMHGPTTSTTDAVAGSVWRVEETGSQTISLFPEPGTDFDVGAVTVTRIGSMTADGPALRFSPPEPGRWIYADVDGGYPPTLTATNSTFAPGVGWSASITDPTSHDCLMPQGPLGCGEQGVATVSESAPEASSYFSLDTSIGAFVFLQVPQGATGSVDLQVTKRAPLSAPRAPAPSARPSDPTR